MFTYSILPKVVSYYTSRKFKPHFCTKIVVYCIMPPEVNKKMKNTYYRRARSPLKKFRHTCVRCERTWRSSRERPRCCPGCRVNNWHKPAREIKYKIDPNTPVGEKLIFAPFTYYKAFNRPADAKDEFPGMPSLGIDTSIMPDTERAYITQATIQRKLNKMGIAWRYAVTPTGVWYIRA